MANNPRQVCKRDGRLTPFQGSKIAAAIRKAFLATGECEPSIADELAEVVHLVLGRRCNLQQNYVPHIEEIQDLVERVLMETGYSKTAKAYILYRNKRAQMRNLLSVRENAPNEKHLHVDLPRGATSPWSKGKIIAALMNEASLPRETAEKVAAHVERKVFRSGMHRLSTTLIRELVDNELFEMGLEASLKSQNLIGIPKYDLGQLLKTGFLAQEGNLHGILGDPSDIAACQLVQRYALEDVLPEVVSDGYRQGRYHFSNLSRLHRDYFVLLRTDLLLAQNWSPMAWQKAAAFHSAESRVNALAQYVAEIFKSTSSFVVISGLENYINEPTMFAAQLQRLAEKLKLLLTTRGKIILCMEQAFVSNVDLPQQKAFTFDGLTYAGPGLFQVLEEQFPLSACGAVASLNLARLAYEAGPWCDQKLLSELERGLDHLVKGLTAITAFQEQVRKNRPLHVTPQRISYAITLEGVYEAIAYMRDGAMDKQFVQTVTTLTMDYLRMIGVNSRLSLVFDPQSIPEAANRFACEDEQRFPVSQQFRQGEMVRYRSLQNVEIAGQKEAR